MGNPISPEASGVIRRPRSPFRLVRPQRTGFRHWLLENYNLLYTLVLISTYASLMLYFAALVIFGGPSLVSNVLFGTFAVCMCTALAPWLVRGGGQDREASLRRVLKTYRPKETERFELIVAITLWSLIGLALAVLFHPGSR
jgi:hypothetical protein